MIGTMPTVNSRSKTGMLDDIIDHQVASRVHVGRFLRNLEGLKKITGTELHYTCENIIQLLKCGYRNVYMTSIRHNWRKYGCGRNTLYCRVDVDMYLHRRQFKKKVHRPLDSGLSSPNNAINERCSR